MLKDVISTDRIRELMDRTGLFSRLAAFDPRWVGSIPLNVHGTAADIDICCCAGRDLVAFKSALRDAFGDEDGFEVHDNTHAGEASVIAYFSLQGIPVEVYGRDRPVETHESYVHWLAEDRLLSLGGPQLRDDVRLKKAGGMKTEPAFAACLDLGGDPYIELLKLASAGDDALLCLIQRAGYGLA